MFIAALFTIAKLWKQPRCPSTDEWIKKMWYLYDILFIEFWEELFLLNFENVYRRNRERQGNLKLESV
jgi:hypothetical protein